jgi:hypothetical protein
MVQQASIRSEVAAVLIEAMAVEATLQRGQVWLDVHKGNRRPGAPGQHANQLMGDVRIRDTASAPGA